AIPVRRYGTSGRRRPAVMLHGLESHSGWFVQSARAIAARGLPVHAFDRCGSGVSLTDAARGARFETLFAEVDAVVAAALEGTSHQKVHLVGHCFGALVALLYAAQHRPARVAGLVLATPALYTRTDLSPARKARILWRAVRAPAAREPVPLDPEDFSELEPFVDFVRRDPLALRSVPARLLFEIWRARFRLPRAAAALRVPVFAALAREEAICDNRRTLALLARVKASVESIEYAGARHILEFSGQRAAFLAELGAWLESQEAP
ncbi:MAG TPA: alpha/beta fold hydrolase, partial [Polyangia bacterium]